MSREKWGGHLGRTQHARFPKHLWIYKPLGRRFLGRLKKRWRSNKGRIGTLSKPHGEKENNKLIAGNIK